MNYYKRVILLILFIVGVSGVVIYQTGDMSTFVYLNAFHPWSIILALIFLSLGMYFDSTRLVTLVKMTGKEISLFQSLQVILSNYFLAMLTPGATGGPVAQVLFLRKLGMLTGQATVLVLVRTILSILFLIICLPAVFYLDVIPIPWLQPQFVNTAVVVLIGIVAGSVWGMRSQIMTRAVLWIAKRISNPMGLRIWRLYRDIQASINLLFSSPRDMARVFVDTGLSLLFLYGIVPALFLGLGITIDWSIIMGRMIILNLLLYFAPTPGGTGIAEGCFVYLFGNFVPVGTVGVLAVVWRILAEYLPFAAGMYFTLKMFGGKLLMGKRSIN